MRLFSRLFYFTVIGGLVASALLDGGIFSLLHYRPDAVLPVFRSVKQDTQSFVTLCVIYAPFISLLFWVAFRIGRRILQHQNPLVAE